ncbi:LysM peptidoglycan-binding domain-containing M23 family metallopeptidase [Algihabitans albus]|uniref:LysM peptidoglycan-binding domain-containing M23 family metallopeptidase n=1 Tax=Algihabitans albus TaxID=2164067 RepID=UPI000E5D440E|nr:LysM peptidoglycan-binding domain-containing M23 family metallopeptidase [Algihabitans albus]
MSRPLLLALAVTLGLSGCLQTASLPEPGVTPMEPPPLPPRRPATPVGFAVQQQELPIPGGLYRVQAGDTVYGVARRAGLPLRALIDTNRLAPPYELEVGRDLIVPRAEVHLVKPGETVYGISRMHSVDMSQLTRINGVGPPYEIRVGQRLVLPEPGLRTEVAVLPEPLPEPPTPPTPLSRQQVPQQLAPQQQAPLPQPPLAQSSPPAETTPRVEPGAEGRAGGPPLPPRRPGTAAEPPSAQPANQTPAPVVQAPRQTQTAAIPQPPPRSGGRFGWPLRGRILSPYGPQDGGRHNDGINIAAPRGAPIQAAENGVVAYVGSELRGYGQLVLVKHADGWVTAYAHADSVTVRLGETVRRGQAIARVGSTGAVDQPQLHFEIRKGTNAVDPLQMLDGAA